MYTYMPASATGARPAPDSFGWDCVNNVRLLPPPR